MFILDCNCLSSFLFINKFFISAKKVLTRKVIRSQRFYQISPPPLSRPLSSMGNVIFPPPKTSLLSSRANKPSIEGRYRRWGNKNLPHSFYCNCVGLQQLKHVKAHSHLLQCIVLPLALCIALHYYHTEQKRTLRENIQRTLASLAVCRYFDSFLYLDHIFFSSL